ncbi:GMC family oxidoreductase [Phycicoccus sp.]|uniref:GMC family oxidoreductase n=1 Tax=Phycicoccus sp. TaxID=1902410 RepID=UPI002CB923EF|nr:GMC family oxidoreductase [Phycicoccus sp.]HMM93527.1 GMC family oxidoreductase [Phycicoccus sp.]
MTPAERPDVDLVVIGSGFGGSVAALRAAEKGYRVLVLEAGRRFADEDFARTSWDLRRFLWAPRLGCYGVQRIHRLPDVVVLAGAGVGGGSLNYANTLYRPPRAFYDDPQWRDLADWESELAPHYDTASRMLGVVTNRCDGPVERAMRGAAEDLGVADTFRHTPVGVFFGRPGETVDDPYFGGAGPRRTGCTECGNCMVGCRVGAKNTLVKNYLALAEGLGVDIRPMRTVVRLGEVPGIDRQDAGAEPTYRVLHERTGPVGGRDRQVVTARHVVVAAGAWGTQTLLHAMRDEGELPSLSARLGHLTRTNSESLVGAMTEHAPRDVDLTRGVAITTSFHVDADTHVENCRYGVGSNAMGLLATLAVPGGTGRPRWAEFLRMVARDPRPLLRMLPTTRRWSERIVVGLVMQSRDNSLRVSGRRRFGRPGLTSTQGHGEPNPTFIPQAQAAMAALADRIASATGEYTVAGGSWPEVLDVPMTAHFLGGAPIGGSPETGVLDRYQRVWGHPGISVLDGSAVSANLGVNPSLTITAQAERAMAHWPVAGEPDPRPTQVDLLSGDPATGLPERAQRPVSARA